MKVTPKCSLVRCLDHPSALWENQHENWQDELNAFSFHGELFWKITVDDDLWNHDSPVKVTSHFTFHGKKIRPFTKISFTTLIVFIEKVRWTELFNPRRDLNVFIYMYSFSLIVWMNDWQVYKKQRILKMIYCRSVNRKRNRSK